MSRSQIIELDDSTVGVVIQGGPGRHRFYASHTPLRPFERRSFSSVKKAIEAARARLNQSRIGSDIRGLSHDARGELDPAASVALGDKVATAVLRDGRASFRERFDGFSFTRFDGTRVRV